MWGCFGQDILSVLLGKKKKKRRQQRRQNKSAAIMKMFLQEAMSKTLEQSIERYICDKGIWKRCGGSSTRKCATLRSVRTDVPRLANVPGEGGNWAR